MDTQAWLDLWHDKLLREYIRDLAAACSHDPAVQTDLIATAWLAVGNCQCDVSVECALSEAGLALIKRYQRYHYREVRRWHEAPVRKRIYRRRKKYFVLVSHPTALV